MIAEVTPDQFAIKEDAEERNDPEQVEKQQRGLDYDDKVAAQLRSGYLHS